MIDAFLAAFGLGATAAGIVYCGILLTYLLWRCLK